MTWLVSSSLRLRVIVLARSILLMIVGERALEKTALDVFPEFAPPMVEIQTEAPGLSTEEVESMISMPIENALSGVPWVKVNRSKSVLGLSSVVLIFEEGTDLIRSRQLVQERLAAEALKAADRRAHARDDVAALVDRAGPQDRRLVENAFADGDDATGPVDNPPAAHVNLPVSPTSPSGASATGSFRCWSIPCGCALTA